MDILNLIAYAGAGMAGGRYALRPSPLVGGGCASALLAGAIGGLIGGQVVERSMVLDVAPISAGSLDPGAAFACIATAALGGASLALAIDRVVSRIGSKRSGPGAT